MGNGVANAVPRSTSRSCWTFSSSSTASSLTRGSHWFATSGDIAGFRIRRYSRWSGGSTSSGTNGGKGIGGMLTPCSDVNVSQSVAAAATSAYRDRTWNPPWRGLHTPDISRMAAQVGVGSSTYSWSKWSRSNSVAPAGQTDGLGAVSVTGSPQRMVR